MWKDILGWEQYYQVNEFGLVKNKKINNIIVGDINSVGYKRVCLYNKNNTPQKERFLRHRLVAFHFLENNNDYHEVNHKDGHKHNNHVDNLEWCSREQNEQHAWNTNLKKYNSGTIKISHLTFTITMERYKNTIVKMNYARF